MPTTFRQISDALHTLLDDIKVAVDPVVAARHPDLEQNLTVHGWGSADAQVLPAAWLSLEADSNVIGPNDGCRVVDELAIQIKLAVEPQAPGAGADFDYLIDVVDRAIPIVDRALRDRHLGVQIAKRGRFGIDNTQLGETNALTLVIPLLIQWGHAIPDPV